MLKQLLPLPVRDRLRPFYHRYKRTLRRYRECATWPVSEAWKSAKVEAGQLNNPEQRFAFAAREFGLVQIKSEILDLICYASRLRPKVIGEIGLKDGGNSALFALAFPELSHLIVLDVELNNVGKLRYLADKRIRITALEGNSQSEEIKRKVERALGGKRFDMLFVDGDHSYDGVKQDFSMYRDLVREGGIIVFHDIVPDMRKQDGLERKSQCYAGGVHQLWNEIRNDYEYHEFVDNWSQEGFGIGAIVKR